MSQQSAAAIEYDILGPVDDSGRAGGRELRALRPESLLRGGSGDSHLFHIQGDGGLGYLYAFSMKQECDPWSAKERIGSMHRHDSHAYGGLPLIPSAAAGVEESIESRSRYMQALAHQADVVPVRVLHYESESPVFSFIKKKGESEADS